MTLGHYVIVGGGIAAVSCIQELLVHIENGDHITVISASNLVKTVANLKYAGRALEQFDVKEQTASTAFDDNRVKVIIDVVTKLDSKQQKIITKSGKHVLYDRLLVATGAKPKKIFNHPAVVSIRDTQTVQDFENKLKFAKRILVIGNGGIATELVHFIRNVDIIWAIKHETISHTFLDAGAAQFLIQALYHDGEDSSAPPDDLVIRKRLTYTVDSTAENAGGDASGSALGPDWAESIRTRGDKSKRSRRVHIEYLTELVEILTLDEVRSRGLSVGHPFDEDEPYFQQYGLLNNGRVFGCDLIISAIGHEANSNEWQAITDRKFELGPDGGIRVDDQMLTNLPRIYAAGDICYAGWKWAPHWFQMRLWTQARQMGAYTARCMSIHQSTNDADRMSLDICFDIFTHCTRFFDYKVTLLGNYNGQNMDADKIDILVRVDPRSGTEQGEYAKIIVYGNRVFGALLIGDTGLEETMENLILNGTDVECIKDDLLNPTVDIEDYFD